MINLLSGSTLQILFLNSKKLIGENKYFNNNSLTLFAKLISLRSNCTLCSVLGHEGPYPHPQPPFHNHLWHQLPRPHGAR